MWKRHVVSTTALIVFSFHLRTIDLAFFHTVYARKGFWQDFPVCVCERERQTGVRELRGWKDSSSLTTTLATILPTTLILW